MKQSQRKFVVFVSLVSILTFTSALLLALAPEPLTPDTSRTLLALDTPSTLDQVFQTSHPSRPGQWKYIYIHQSSTLDGDAMSLARTYGENGDHFVIGNGEGAIDGEIQIGPRWNDQRMALPPRGAESMDPACVSICLIGDFDKTVPTPVQLRRLSQLVTTLQGRYHIGSNNVLLVENSPTAAGIGKYFPSTAFREQLLH